MTAKNYDIAIIGGGVIGLALARALQKSDASIAVFDAAREIPPASFAAAGMLSPSFELADGDAELAEALYRFGAYSLSQWSDFAATLQDETGTSIDYRTDGTLGVANSTEELEAWRAQTERVASLGGDVAMISGDEARALEPALASTIIGAMLAPKDAQVDPRRLTAALEKSLRVKQITARIIAVKKDGDCYRINASGGEAFNARTVVYAGGAVSGLVAKEIVFPVKGEATAIGLNEGTVRRVIRHRGAYLCPKAGGRMVIGASEMRGRDDLDIDASAIARLRTNAALIVPASANANELERWSGLRPGTADGAPILGRNAEGCFLALGHYRNGILHTPAATEAMAALILGNTQTPEIAAALGAFSPDRLATT